jgi:hypothetical protein
MYVTEGVSFVDEEDAAIKFIVRDPVGFHLRHPNMNEVGDVVMQ